MHFFTSLDEINGTFMTKFEYPLYIFSFCRAADMPEHAFKAAMKELKRLKKMPQHMPEQAMLR